MSFEMPPRVPKPVRPKEEGRHYFVVLIFGITVIFVGAMLIFLMKTDKEPTKVECNYNVTCSNSQNEYRETNIQASHGYHQWISQKGIQVCVVADEFGRVWGNSMQPTYFEGNTAIIENLTNQTLHEGDIIRFFRDDCESPHQAEKAVIHRVSAVYGDNIVVQGDNLYETEVIKRCQVTGIVVGIIFS